MKAIVAVERPGAATRHARAQLTQAGQGKEPDYRLTFESARTLFAELTPARMELLDTLRRVGPCSVYALAKAASRNYSNVHRDTSRLEALGLVERDGEGSILVPYESVEIVLRLAEVA